MSKATKRVRCAIYTRKSTEEGLDQEFNSLDAQREACEAYIRSQAGEGWRALSHHYDDGGYSGGNLDRPAMQQLLADVDMGKIDVIVVYKVDRLTRSLIDFARVVERLDVRGISFVSVTQAFNTTTSMGRLTLNVLLSFAQFEREVTGERIRDKIAASKAKGMWMGGNVPLGYDLQDRRLVVNLAEAEQVRHIFSRYIELRSGVSLVRELRREGIVSKHWISRSGQTRGGLPLSCGALYYLLQNRLYLGEIVHRGVRHKGQHDAIVSEDLFAAVQQALAENRCQRRKRPTRAARCLLAGLVYDADGQQLTTSFSYGRGGKLYRYYVSGSLDPDRETGMKKPTRVPAAPLERLVASSVRKLVGSGMLWHEVLTRLIRVELRRRTIQLVLKSDSFLEPGESFQSFARLNEQRVSPDRLIGDSDNVFRLVIERTSCFRGGKRDCAGGLARSTTAELADQLRSSHELLKTHSMSPFNPDVHAFATAPAYQRQRRLMSLGLIAPALQKSILQNRVARLPADFANLPLAWADQLHALRCNGDP
ncbi:MAG: recombinase family protein [Alphaproteobacteria bacterium]